MRSLDHATDDIDHILVRDYGQGIYCFLYGQTEIRFLFNDPRKAYE